MKICAAHAARGVKQISGVKLHPPGQNDLPAGNTPDIYGISIEEMLKSVNDNAWAPYVQDGTKGTFYQPVNPGVDLKETVRGVVVHPALSAAEASRVKTNQFKKEFARKIAGNYRNEDTGWDIGLSARNVSHAVYSALNNTVVDFETSVNILEGLPDIIRNAKLIESHEDRHGQEQVKQIHRLFSSVKLSGDNNTTYTVKLTVKEIDGKYVAEIENIYKAYDAKVEKKASDATRGPLPYKKGPKPQSSETYEISIADMLKNVNDNAGVPYLQPSRGSISFPMYEGAPVTVRLGKDADRSTFVHEFAHLYFWHLRNLASLDTVRRGTHAALAAPYGNQSASPSGEEGAVSQNSAEWDGPEASQNRAGHDNKL